MCNLGFKIKTSLKRVGVTFIIKFKLKYVKYLYKNNHFKIVMKGDFSNKMSSEKTLTM